jgi:pyridoxine/pyridoxamine 5'-phosphate oxidase
MPRFLEFWVPRSQRRRPLGLELEFDRERARALHDGFLKQGDKKRAAFSVNLECVESTDPRLTTLDGQKYDVVVMGAGVNGASAAQHLSADGCSVLLVDRGDFAPGSSSRSSRVSISSGFGVEAMAVATAARGGKTSIRFVLLKRVDERGFVFFTDARSRKGRELRGNLRASLAFYWQPKGLQVRVEGRVEEVTPPEADAYWSTRPRQTQLAANVSHQSARLRSRTELLTRFAKLARKLKILRSPFWTGFRVRIRCAKIFGFHRQRPEPTIS